MDEYAASYSCIEKIVNATQSIKECLVCRICLELFKEPITLKCNHKFCRSCILKVTKNENAACPFCYIKIHKRSIPKEGNVLLESVVQLFNNLTEAIRSDSGINALKPLNILKHTKESVSVLEKSNISKPGNVSTISTKSTIKNINKLKSVVESKKSKKSKSRKRDRDHSLESSSNRYNFLNEEVYSEEKVKSWLKNITSDEGSPVSTNECKNDINLNTNICNEDLNPIKKLPGLVLTESDESLSNRNLHTAKLNYSKCNVNEHLSYEKEEKYKEIEINTLISDIAKNKKLNKIFQDKAVLKASNSVAVSSHSNADDWHRVKRVGKEMQIKTFKALNVSIEKNSSSVVLDDTVPCNNTINDTKHISREADTNIYLCNNNTSLKAKSLEENDSLQEKENTRIINNDSDNKYHSVDSSYAYNEENNSFCSADSKKIKEIIGILPIENNLNTSEVTEDVSNKLELETKLNLLSPLKKKFNKIKALNCKTALKKKLTSNNSNVVFAESNIPDKIQIKKKSTNSSPESPGIRLPLKGLNNDSNECFINQKKSIKNHTNCSDLPMSNRSSIMFTKLGKMSRKRKNISFVWLGSLKPKQKVILYSPNKEASRIIIKSNEPANFNYTAFLETRNFKRSHTKNYNISREVSLCKPEEMKVLSPEKDSQLKFLSIESPIYVSDQKIIDINENKNEPIVYNLTQSNISMEIDENEFKENECSANNTNPSDKCRTEIIDANEQIYEIDIKIDTEKNKDKPENVEISEIMIKNQVRKNSVQKDLVDESFIETEYKNTENYNTQKSDKNEITCTERSSNKNSEVKTENESEEDKSFSSSSSFFLVSDRKKKRTHSESSNDDVSSIIDKWCNPEEEPIIKKQKTVSNNAIDLIFDQNENKVNDLDILSANDDNTLTDNEVKELKVIKKQNDPSVDKIMNEDENFEKNTINTKKLMDMPTLSLSVDLFESNKHCVKLHSQLSPKQGNKIVNDHSPINNKSTNKSSQENLNLSPVLLNNTVIDVIQFEDNKLNPSQNSQNSNKEDSACNQVHKNSVINRKHDDIDEKMKKITSQKDDEPELIKNDCVNDLNMYDVPETLMNITQEQITLKKIEKALIGVNLSEINLDEMNESNKFSTPKSRKTKNSINNNTDDDDFDSENIDATPISKKRHLQQLRTTTSASNLEKMKTVSPQTNKTLIAAVTPVKNTKCYPLSHSTPMISTSPPKSKSSAKKKSIILVCTGLQPENIKLVQLFAKKFGIGFHNNFDIDVTHVIVQTDVRTNAGQKTFKYIQGIAFKKYVINFQWVLDCLNENRLLNENDEKYDVLDPDIFESGSKKSRNRTEELFDDFVFYCQGPFNSFPLNEFRNVIVFNGGSVAPTLKSLSFYKDKYKVVILDHENFSQSKLASLKKSQAVLISFEWIIDSLSQFHILSLSSYLCGMTVEEAIAVGYPPEYFVEEEKEDDEDEGELE